jgi:hypothetical protein
MWKVTIYAPNRVFEVVGPKDYVIKRRAEAIDANWGCSGISKV